MIFLTLWLSWLELIMPFWNFVFLKASPLAAFVVRLHDPPLSVEIPSLVLPGET
jgi:hypothetical protein